MGRLSGPSRRKAREPLQSPYKVAYGAQPELAYNAIKKTADRSTSGCYEARAGSQTVFMHGWTLSEKEQHDDGGRQKEVAQKVGDAEEVAAVA